MVKRPFKENDIIALAWQDRISFEEIKRRSGLDEKQVIAVMRQTLKPGSFRRWRKRVNGRVTKHERRFRLRQKPPEIDLDGQKFQ